MKVETPKNNRAHSEYFDSGSEWLGRIPTGWRVVRSKSLFTQRKERAFPGDEQLTASQEFGVIPQKEFMEKDGHRVTQVITGMDILKHVEPNDFVISMRSFQGGIELSKHRGCISSAYVALIPSEKIDPTFFSFLLKSKTYIQALQRTTNLVRDGQALRFENFSLVDLPLIPLSEQREIASFLRKKISQVDLVIQKKEHLIQLLKEKRTALISNVVTRGLNPKTKLKQSGIDWLSNIPEEWRIMRVKHVFRLSNEKNNGADVPLLSLTQKGIKTRDLSTNEGQWAANYENYTRVRVGDIVFNPMDLVSGSVDNSTMEGIISLGYTVLRPFKEMEHKFYKYYFKWHYLQRIFFPFGQGVSTDHRWTLKDKTLMNFPIVYPPLEEQEVIGKYIEGKEKSFFNAENLILSQIEKLKEYRSSLIYSAVTGKIAL